MEIKEYYLILIFLRLSNKILQIKYKKLILIKSIFD